MGVKSLIVLLKKYFPGAFSGFSPAPMVKFKEVFVDTNPILHRTCRGQLNEISTQELSFLIKTFNEQPPDSSTKTSFSPSNLLFNKAQMSALSSCDFLNNLYRCVFSILYKYYSTSKLVLSVDGSASLAKLKLQRDRRVEIFQAHQMSKYAFSAKKFTPGNLFMGLIDRQMMAIAQDFLLSRPNPGSPYEIYYDGSTRAGESELKIYNDILYGNTTVSSFNSDKTVIGGSGPDDSLESRRLIVSSDSDSILHAIASWIPNVYCVDPFSSSLRLNMFSTDEFFKLIMVMEPQFYLNVKNDLVFLILCAGNDYFPAIKKLNLSILWLTYVNFRAQLKSQGIAPYKIKLIDMDKKALNLKFFRDLANEYIKVHQVNEGFETEEPFLNHQFKPCVPSISAGDSGNSKEYTDFLESCTNPAGIQKNLMTHLQLMLWCMNTLFTKKISNNGLVACKFYEPSIRHIVNIELNSSSFEENWFVLDEPKPLKSLLLPLTSSLLLLDYSEVNTALFPESVQDLYRDFNESSARKKNSDLENFHFLNEQIMKIPRQSFSAYEFDCCFPSIQRSLLTLVSNQGSNKQETQNMYSTINSGNKEELLEEDDLLPDKVNVSNMQDSHSMENLFLQTGSKASKSEQRFDAESEQKLDTTIKDTSRPSALRQMHFPYYLDLQGHVHVGIISKIRASGASYEAKLAAEIFELSPYLFENKIKEKYLTWNSSANYQRK